MIVIFSGLPGSGKSYKLGKTVVGLLYANRKRYEKAYTAWAKRAEPDEPAPVKRPLWTNLKLAPQVEEEFKGYIEYWTDLRQLTPLRDCDVIIDEVATYFDARLWETLSLEMRRWLAQHRKFGIEIYGTTQDFAQVDKAFRRLTSDLVYLSKLMGSRDISATRSPPKFVWGICLVRYLDPTVYDELKSKFGATGIPKFMFITRAGVNLFDTRAEVQLSSALPLRHIEIELKAYSARPRAPLKITRIKKAYVGHFRHHSSYHLDVYGHGDDSHSNYRNHCGRHSRSLGPRLRYPPSAEVHHGT